MKVCRLTLLAAAMLCGLAFAATPNLINYQGRLTNSAGMPVADGSYSVSFTLYDAPSSGVPQWGETQSVTTSNGLFNVKLGSVVLFGSDLFNDTALYLAIKVGVDPEISPRTRLTAVPYALSSGDGWSHEGATVHLTTNTDAVGIGTSAPIRPLHVSDPAGGLFVSRIESGNIGATVTEISNTSSNAVWEASVAGSAGIPFWGLQPGDMYFYKQGTSWPNAVLTSSGSLGLGTSLPRARLEAVTTDTISGFFAANAASNSTHVVHSEYTGSSQVDAVAVYGKSVPAGYYGYGGKFVGGYVGAMGQVVQDGPNNYMGLYGEATGSGSGNKFGLRGYANGFGKCYGSYGSASSTNDTAFGLYGIASGPQSRGVYGQADGDSSAGGHFRSNSTGIRAYGIGKGDHWSAVGGYFSASNAASDSVAFGIYTQALGPGYHVAIRAVSSSDGHGWNRAGEFTGDVYVSGFLSKTAGSFMIDHPLDPANKYLQHSFVESPDMMNVYNGNVVLDASGNATITLPPYFEALNRDFRYQLTCIGGFAPVYISSEISDNAFSIAGGTPSLKVSWTVTGIRKDAYAEAHRIQVEVDKEGRDRGKFLHPDLFGAPEQERIGYVPPAEIPESMSAEVQEVTKDNR